MPKPMKTGKSLLVNYFRPKLDNMQHNAYETYDYEGSLNANANVMSPGLVGRLGAATADKMEVVSHSSHTASCTPAPSSLSRCA